MLTYQSTLEIILFREMNIEKYAIFFEKVKKYNYFTNDLLC